MRVAGWTRSALLAAITAPATPFGSSIAWRLLDAEATPVFFASAGVTSAALVASRRRHWVLILTAVALTELGFDLGHGVALPTALGLVLANTVEPLIGALLVRRLVGFPDLSQRRDTALYLGACVVVAPLIGALIGTTTLVLGSGAGWVTTLLPFWAGDALGVLTVGSAILAWVTIGQRGDRSPWQVPVAAGMAALTAAATVTSFDSSRAPFVLPLAALFLAALGRRRHRSHHERRGDGPHSQRGVRSGLRTLGRSRGSPGGRMGGAPAVPGLRGARSLGPGRGAGGVATYPSGPGS